MVYVHSPQKKPYSEIANLAVAISGDEDQRHLGVLIRIEPEEDLKFIHLAFHYDLRCDEPDTNAFYVECSGLDPEEQLSFAVWVEAVRDANGADIPYSFAYASGNFDPGGRFIKRAEGVGLTCATFVVALFEDFAFPIVDVESWRPRPDDVGFQEKIVKLLARFWPGPHAEAQRESIGKASRFRPEEICGCAHVCDGTPLRFQEGVGLGAEVLAQMRAHWAEDQNERQTAR